MVLAITSHVPHLIAYNIVNTARHLERVTDTEVIKFSAGGFRDFTRIAASDPVMWRDVFLNNKEAVLEMLGRFSEDLTALQRAIRFGDGETLLQAVRGGARGAARHHPGRPGYGRARLRPARRRRTDAAGCAGQEALGLMTRGASRSVGVRLRIADVAAGFRLRGGAARPPDRLPPLLLHLLRAPSRHARAARHGAGARPRRRLRGHRLSRRGRATRRDHRLSALARAGQRRLSRGASAGRDHGGREPRGDGARPTSSSGRIRAMPGGCRSPCRRG